MHRLKPPPLSAGLVARHAWKLGLGLLILALFSMQGVTQFPVHLHQQNLAAGGGPTTIPCGPLPSGTTTWSAAGSPYILPLNTTNDPVPNDPNACPAFALPGGPPPTTVPGVVVPPDGTLIIDASQGPVQIFSHGSGITVNGGVLQTANTSAVNFVSFEAEPDVASWDGISVVASDSSHRGNAALSYVSIAHALTSITINSGAESTVDPLGSGVPLPYGFVLANSAIGPSFFDGIDATNTPISLTGHVDSNTGRPDGQFGTLNNIGSQGIKVTFDPALANYPAVIPSKSLDVENMTFGSSVPFGEINCLPLASCAAGTIGNDAIQSRFVANAQQPVLISNNQFFRAGSYALELNNSKDPVLTANTFSHNGIGSTQPAGTCLQNAINKFPPIYLNNAVVDLENHVTGNFGQQDGLEAIVFNGTVSSPTFTWKTASTDSSKPLGYLLNGDLDMVGGTFKVPGGSVVKASHGTLNLNGATLDAGDTGAKTFTSLRDSSVGIDAVCSVFVQSSPPTPLPAGEWGGIDLVGSGTDAAVRNATRGTINNASILYATTGVNILNGASLAVSRSSIGPTFADGVMAEGTPIAITGTTFGCPTGVCSGPSSGNHGVFADFRGASPLAGGLKVGGPNPADKNTFQGSVNEAIRGVGLGGQPVDIENNAIQNAGAVGSAGSAGIYLQGADSLTLKGNDVTGSGTGNVHYPAIWLDGVSHADFSGPISGNTGSANGLNGIAFHGDTKTLVWQTVQAGGLLGFIIDGDLRVAGDLTLTGDYAPVLAGTITVQNGTLSSTGGSVLTSLKEQPSFLKSCGSVFVPRVSGVCSAASAGDWGGLVLDPSEANQLTDSGIRYAVTGISIGMPSGSRSAENLTLIRTSISNTSSDGLNTQSPVSITGGAFTNNGGHGITIDLTGVAPIATQPLTITGHTAVSGSGKDGILAVGLAGQTVQIEDATVDRTGAFGINLMGADHLTLVNNTVTNTAATFPAIYLNGFSGLFANITGNRGASNGVDAIAFHGTVTDDLIWQTARKTADPTKLLGFVLDNTLTMQSPHTLTVNAGDIVKVGNGGLLKLPGVNLKADDTANSSQKVFTSMTDDSVGVATCHSAVVTGCTGDAQAGDWGGISLTGTGANAALVNAAVRYATTGILINSGASATSGSSVYGLAVSRSSIGPSAGDGIDAMKTSISVTDSVVSSGSHGINVDETGSISSTTLRLSGNRFMSTSAEAILGQALGGGPVWITDNRIQGAGTFGMRLLNADQLVLRNNNVAGSGGGPGAGAGRYPAIYLNALSADFVRNIRGNVGSGNGLDAVVFDGKVTSDLTWITPSDSASTHSLGYLLDGGVTLQGGNLSVGAGAVVKALGGSITINGGALDASASGARKIFTSLRDNSDSVRAAAVSCPSVFAPFCTPSSTGGDWGGLVITENGAQKGSGNVVNADVDYADTGISIDSGPFAVGDPAEPGNFRLMVSGGTTIANASKDGINALDTPISVRDSTIQSVGARGIIASFFSPANCSTPAPPCSRLTITNNQITGTGKDGIIANGLVEQPITVSGNTVTGAGAYGIRLVGADQITLVGNTVNTSGIAPNAYPAIYLNNVSGDFNSAITGNLGAGNGLDALVFHGTANNGLTWLTPGNAGTTLGFMLDGPLTVNGKLTATGLYDPVTNALLKPGVVKVLTGAIKVNGVLSSTDTFFTSMKEKVDPLACATVFIPSACPVPVLPSDYWGGINVDPVAISTFTGGGIRFATTGLVVHGPLNLSGASIHDISGTAVDTSGGTLTADCSSIHSNGIGVAAGSNATLAQSDVFGNTTYDLVAPTGASATYDWWGSATGGKFGTTPSTVVTNKLASQQPVATLTPTDTVMTSTNAFGIGNMTLTADFSRRMAKDPTEPLVAFSHAGDLPPPHSLTGSWTTDQRWTADPYALNLGTATAGTNTLTVSGARSCVPDPSTNLMTPASQDFTAAIQPTSLSVAPSSGTYGGTTSLSATLTDPGTPLANGKVDFVLNAKAVGSQTTDNAGNAVLNNVSVVGIDAGSHSNIVVATYGGDNTFSPSSAMGDLTLARAPLTVTVDNQSRAYGAANPTLTVTPTGLINPDTLTSIALGASVSTTATAGSPVGTYPITVNGPSSTTNYTLTYVSGTLTVTTTVPGAPSAVTASPGNAQATVSWTAPASDGGSAITSYTVTASPGGAHATTPDGLTTTATVTGLTNGTAYTFTVVATNAVGDGPASAASNSVTPVTVPGAPTGVTATAGSSSASVSWTAPANDGGSAISGYTVTSTPGNLTATSSGTSATVSGLTNGTAYTFTVVATNAVGDGPASAASNSVTPVKVPGAPTGVTASAGNAQATVNWTAPVDTGGSAITSYTVTASPGGAHATTPDGLTTTATVTGLTNGTAYTFTVVATNAVGDGPASAASNSVTPVTVPGAPTAVTATAGSSSASFSWTAPANDGGSAISGYTVTSTPDNLTANTSGTSATVSGLTPKTAYTFTVVATNAAGTGPASAASNSVTPYTTPGAPTAVAASAGSSSASVNWSAPSDDGGNPISLYTVTSTPGNLTATASGTSVTVSGLTPKTAYTFTVVATNAAGPGPTSAASNSVTPYTNAGAPTAVMASPGNAQATVSWTAPSDDGGSAITKYTVTSSPDGKTAVTSDGSTFTATVTGLTNGTVYTFTVVATNAAGDGSASAASASITVGAPAAPSAVTAVAGTGQADVSWTAPADNGSSITGYTVTPYDGTTAGTPIAVSGTSTTVTGLTSGHTYTFQVTATNAIGTGPAATSNSVSPT